MTTISNRYDFVYLFDVANGNPNGDPDSGNRPRMRLDGRGLVTDVCVKRKVRNYVSIATGIGELPMASNLIYVTEGAILNELHAAAYADIGADPAKPGDKIPSVRDRMCAKYWDVRMCGAMMATEVDAGVVRGPLQIGQAVSIDPIDPQEITITRMAAAKREQRRDGTDKDAKTMGSKWIVPYGLYRVHGTISPAMAAKTGATEADLGVLWSALMTMWDHDRSAARMDMQPRGLVVFKHRSALGNAPSGVLYDSVSVERRAGIEAAACWRDYSVTIDRGSIPSGVEVIEMIACERQASGDLPGGSRAA